MKKLTAVILCAAAALSLAACTPKSAPPEETEPIANMVNPFVDYESLEDANEAAGFELAAPNEVTGYSDKMIQVMSGKMIQIIFLNGDDRLFVRKQAGDEDISGDYSEHSQTVSADVDGRTVTLKGDDDLISTAIWTSEGYSYAVMADTPMTKEAMTALISQIA